MCQRFSPECFHPSLCARRLRRRIQFCPHQLWPKANAIELTRIAEPPQQKRNLLRKSASAGFSVGTLEQTEFLSRWHTNGYNCLFPRRVFPLGFGAGRTGCFFRCFRPFRVAPVVPVASILSVVPTAPRLRPVTATRRRPDCGNRADATAGARNRPIALIKQVKLKEPAAPLASPHR